MAIITIREVARVGDKFYMPGRYEIPDQAVFYSRKNALIDFLASSLTTSTEAGVRIDGLMTIESQGFTLKRHDTVYPVAGLNATIDVVGNVILDNSTPTYKVISRQPYSSGTVTPAYLEITSTGELTIEPNAWTRPQNIPGGLRVLFTKSGYVDILINGEPAGREELDVIKLQVTVTNNKVGTAPISKVKITENGTPVIGLDLMADDVSFQEIEGVYHGNMDSMSSATETRKLMILDSRPWDVPDLIFEAAELKDFVIEGVPEKVAPGSSFVLTAVPDPEFTYGSPSWTTTSGTVNFSDNVAMVEVSVTDAEITATWNGITKTVTVDVIQDIEDFVVEGMPSEVENGKTYNITVKPTPVLADGKATFSSSIDGVTITDHMDNTATINVIDMKGPGDVTVYWGDITKDYPLTLKEIPLTVVADPSNITELDAGSTATLKVIWTPKAPDDVEWTVSNGALLTILEDSESSVTFKLSDKASEGNQWCTVTGGGKELRLPFRVKIPAPQDHDFTVVEGSVLNVPVTGTRGTGFKIIPSPVMTERDFERIKVVSRTDKIVVDKLYPTIKDGKVTLFEVGCVTSAGATIGKKAAKFDLTYVDVRRIEVDTQAF